MQYAPLRTALTDLFFIREFLLCEDYEMKDIALKLASEQDFFNQIVKKYLDAYKKIPGVADAVVNDWDSQSVGRHYWFTIYLKTNKDRASGKRHFTNRLDSIRNALARICFKPDRLYNVVMPERIRERNMFHEWVYRYDVDDATVEIFIYNENER